MTKNLLWLSCATGALVLGAGAANAATATAAASSEGGTVAELVVVAEHHETALQKIPVAVSVFTGAERDTIGISTVQDVTNFAPGFVYDTTTTHPYIRGVGRQSVNVTDDERVASYEDELFVYTAYELKQSSLFLTQEQIERGPQNVGGRNAAAGSIDMISVRPTDHPYAEIRASGANYGAWNIEAAASGQIAPGLTARIAGSYLNQDEGYFRNLARPANAFGGTQGGDQHEWYVQGQMEWKPTDRDDVWVKAFWSGWDRQGGDAGGRAGIVTGHWDMVELTDPDACLICSIWVNPNYGYAAINPAAAAGHDPGDPLPIAVTLSNPAILDNPSITNAHNIATTDPLDHTVNLKNYRGIQLNYTHDFNGWQVRYITGIQGYDYDLDEQDGDTNVLNYTLPGNGVGSCGIFGFLGVPSCAGTLNTLAFFSGPGAAQTALAGLAAALPAASNLVINPAANLHYTEDDYWWSHELTFQSTDKGPFQWQFGAWWYNQHYTNPITWTANQASLSHPNQLFPFLGALASPGNFGGAGNLGLTNLLEFFTFTPAQAAATEGLFNAVATGLVPAAPNPNNLIALLNYDISVHSVAGYGQFSYAVNDQFKVTGNVRYSSDSKGGTEQTRDVGFSEAFIDPLLPFLGANTPSFDLTLAATCPSGNPADCYNPAAPLGKGVLSFGTVDPATGIMSRKIGGHSSAVTGGAGVEYTPTNDIFIYARYGRGYEDIAFNAGFNSANPEVGPEFLNAYEVGYKQNFGGKLRLDAAVFYYDYEAIQLPISVNVGGILENEFINAPKAESTGFELEAYWAPIKPLSLTLSYSFDYTAVLTDCTGTVAGGILTPAAGALCLVDTQDPAAVEPGAKPVAGQNFAASGGAINQSIKGNPLPGAPLNKIALNAAYTWNFEPGDFTLSGSVEWRDAQNGTVFNVFSDKSPSWYGIDLRALWKGRGDKYEIIAYVKNLTNTLQYQTGTGGPGLFGDNTHTFSPATGLDWQNATNFAPPRTYGVEVRYKFF